MCNYPPPEPKDSPVTIKYSGPVTEVLDWAGREEFLREKFRTASAVVDRHGGTLDMTSLSHEDCSIDAQIPETQIGKLAKALIPWELAVERKPD